MASEGDLERIRRKLVRQGIAVPPLTETTIIAEDRHGNILAFAAFRVLPFAYFHFDPSLSSHRAAMPLSDMMDNMVAMAGWEELFTGLDPRVSVMDKIAQRFGYSWWGESLYRKVIKRTLKT